MISPADFGPQLWRLLHAAAQHYPAQPSLDHREEMNYMLMGLPALVPCASCRDETRRFLAANLHAGILDSDDMLFAFTVQFHNWVNARLGKPQLSIRQARRIYPRLAGGEF